NKKKWQQKIMHLIDQNLSSDEEWEIFEQNFAEVHEEFLNNLSILHADLTSGELKLAAYIRMDLSSKEIAPLLNISLRSVENKRYRLRKKLGLEHDDNLSSYLLKL
ncbi:MAG: LuxR C-terminal-related transcriptional regulator, partial [Candidatus Moraniibacteriota bacterium]